MFMLGITPFLEEKRIQKLAMQHAQFNFSRIEVFSEK